MSGEIVPFGKYKDKPVEVMLADTKYIEWLVQHPWFREKYVNLYTIVTGITSEAAETPEHNALQIKFLDPKFQERFVRHLISEEDDKHVGGWDFEVTVNFEVGHPPIDVVLYGEFSREPTAKEIQQRYQWTLDNHKAYLLDNRSMHYMAIENDKEPSYEEKVPLKSECCNRVRWTILERRIEIKPTLGDDYPAVLRQMKKSGAGLLLIGEYTGIGATEAQLRAFFATAKIRVILLSELGEGV